MARRQPRHALPRLASFTTERRRLATKKDTDDVARPKVPLISKRRTLLAALEIIDAEGLDALSVRRLAQELNVNAASLYHHFRNKDEILTKAAALALEGVRTPTSTDGHWREWLPANGNELRLALTRHPDLIPIMMRRETLGIGLVELDSTAALLEAEGVPVAAIAPVLEFGELLAIVSALAERERGTVRPVPSEQYPALRKAALKRASSVEQVFIAAYLAGADAIIEDVRVSAGVAPARKSNRRTPARTSAK